MTDEKPVSKPWNWPREWWVDEKFWREVATRTVAGVVAAVIVIGIGYLYAVYSGYLQGPEWGSRLRSLLLSVLNLVTLAVMLLTMRGDKNQGKGFRNFVLVIFILIITYMLATPFLAKFAWFSQPLW